MRVAMLDSPDADAPRGVFRDTLAGTPVIIDS
jgi:hypothetical protein